MPPTIADRAASLNLPDEELRELAGLTYCDGPLISSLEQCPALLRMFAQALDLPWFMGKENHPLVRQELAAALVGFLAWLVQTGRDNVLGSAAGQNKKLSHATAVMGELLRLSNEDNFKAWLEKSRCVQIYANAASRKEHKHDRGERQLRAAMWLNPPKGSARTMARKEKEESYPYIVFRQILRDQLRESKGIEAREKIEAKLPREVVEALWPEPEPTASSHLPDHIRRPPLQPTYAHRPELEAKFRSLVDAGARLIVLVGQAGMGKTWLAEELTRDPVTGQPAPIIDASKQDNFFRNLMAAFSSMGAQLPPSTDPAIQLANLACREDAPPFIVLDNLDSASRLKDLLPRHTKSIIVATCRSEADPPTTYECIHVERMEPAESAQMISLRLPALSSEDTKYLAMAFGSYPLVMNYVCWLYPNQTSSMASLCGELQRDAQKLAAQVQTEDQSILLVILRRLVALVRQRDKGAYELLVLICFTQHRLYHPVVAHYFRTFLQEGRPTGARLAYAVGLLKSLSLIQLEPASTLSKGYIVIHPFTQSVLAQEFKLRVEDVLNRLRVATPPPLGDFEIQGHVTADERLEMESDLFVNTMFALIIWAMLRQPDFWEQTDEKHWEVLARLYERQSKHRP